MEFAVDWQISAQSLSRAINWAEAAERTVLATWFAVSRHITCDAVQSSMQSFIGIAFAMLWVERSLAIA
ncbi:MULTISPECIES: hypothetical protein [unclassified Novosphingobium]|jgi:hypothetical protein|uniref:hypothetical protein n=1 Tax=unclassified Novosphingobium TaxID=2644732 RepID=UPI0025D6EE95|nr:MULTISPECIES: hypothetical protein [unclassified Novosphingobium]HQV04496.1 hypothetical protein [Novosphingobium sp.]